MKIDVLGVGFDNVTTEQAAAQASELIRSGGKAYAVTPNPEIVWQCRTNEALRATINGAGLILPDGIGIIIGAKILGRPLRGGRVTGMNFAAALFRDLAATGGSVFLLGAKPGYAVLAGEKLQEEYPGLIIAGAADGYFTDASQIIREVNAANPDLLLVCLGAPKQEFWIAENIDQLNTRLCVGLGGAIDVFAGKVKRAPKFFQKLGLEWLYRLAREPWRIKRCAVLPLFLLAVIFERLPGGRKKKKERGLFG